MTVFAEVDARCARDGERVQQRKEPSTAPIGCASYKLLFDCLFSDSGRERDELDYPKNGGDYTPDFS